MLLTLESLAVKNILRRSFSACQFKEERPMHVIYRHLKHYSLIYLGLAIYLLFYVSVAWTGWFDFLFSGAALHVGAKGIDFYQIPKGAWAFWHGGTLSGDLPAGGVEYAPLESSNGNVYHPFFSLLFGSFLTLFDPARAPYVWLWTKLFLSLIVMVCFFWNFRASKYISLAIFVLCANFSIYLELAAWQFQFILNIFLLLFLIALAKKQSAYWSGIWYWSGMLIKPIGLLFVPVLLLKGRWKIAVLGIWLFFVSTIVFVLRGTGSYYINNLISNLTGPNTAGPNQIITFASLLRYTTHWPDLAYQSLQNGVLLLTVFLGILRRTHIAKAVFLLVVYYLCFYNAVFEYQWSTLAYALAVCIVTCPEFQSKPAIFCILLTCLPCCFALLNHWHIDVKVLGNLGSIPGSTAWEWMVVSKLLPLFLLLATVLAPDIKPAFKQVKAFWGEMRKVNQRLGVFGEQPAEALGAESQSAPQDIRDGEPKESSKREAETIAPTLQAPSSSLVL